MASNEAVLLERTFLAKYCRDAPVALTKVPPGFLLDTPGAADLFAACNGASFNGGLYRLLKAEQIPRWNSVAGAAFPQFADKVDCFGSDWLGRLFALDPERLVDNKPGVLILEPGTGEALEVPAHFVTFHCVELIESADAALAVEAYESWRKIDPKHLAHHECVGYNVPLFLGGADTIANMERGDMELYWDLCVQLLRQIRTP